MNAIPGVYRNGRIDFAVPPDWPEDCAVLIEPLPAESPAGMREEDWPTTPDGLAELLRRWDAHEPLEMTPEEEADLAAWRQKVKAYTIVSWDKSIGATPA